MKSKNKTRPQVQDLRPRGLVVVLAALARGDAPFVAAGEHRLGSGNNARHGGEDVALRVM